MRRTDKIRLASSIIMRALAGYCLLSGTLERVSATCITPPTGLIGWWRAEGNTADTTGTNSGTLIGGASFGPGEVGQAFVFPTDGAAVKVPASSSLNVGAGAGFTVECWVNPSDLTKRSQIVEWNNGVTYGAHLQILGPDEFGLGAGNLFADLHGVDGRTGWIMAPGGTLVSNVWQHVVLSYNKSTGVAQLLRNGVIVAQANLGSYSVETSYDFYIGYRPAGGGNVSFAGSIDEVSLYSRALSQAELLSIFNASTVGKCLVSTGSPSIVGISPQVGNVGTSVNITGLNFSPITSNNIVYFGAVRAAVTAATATSLQVNVPAGAIFAPITVTVNGLSAYSPISFTPTYLGNGSALSAASFAPRLDLGAGSGPYLTRLGDLDGDGKPDMVVAQLYSGEIWIYRNISTNGPLSAASFAAPVVLTTDASVDGLHGLVLADLDGDGRLDIVFGNMGLNKISVFQNLCGPGVIATNSFGTKFDLPAGIQSFDLAVNDLDLDGKPDIAVGNYGSGTISIFRNVGASSVLTAASFAAKVDFSGPAGVHGIALADVDGDGRPDVVAVGSGGVSDIMSVLKNLSSAGSIDSNSFAPGVAFSGGGEMVVVGDLDGDGKPELVTGSYQKSILSVFKNTVTAGTINSNSFAARVDFPAGGNVHQVALGDLDGDGKLDIALVTESPQGAQVFVNHTAGALSTNSFSSSFSLSGGANPAAIAIGDLEGDGRPEVLLANTFDTFVSIHQNHSAIGSLPVITAQPTNQSINIGGSVSFDVEVSGASPFTFQWRHAGTNISDATSSALSLTNVQSNDAGFYSVLVSNAIGSTLSSNALLTVTSPPPNAVNAPSGLVGWWRAEGSAVDSVGTNPGLLMGGAGFGPGEVGQAFEFPDTGAAVKVPANSVLDVGKGNGFTIECWIFPNDLTKRSEIVEWNNGTMYGTHLQILGPSEFGLGAGNLFADIHGDDGRTGWIMAPGGTLVSNVWQHVALTYDKATGIAKLFRDGVMVAQATLGVYTPQTSYDLYIGYRPAGGGNVSFSGAIDEVSLYNRALTQAEVQSISNAGSGGKSLVPATAPSVAGFSPVSGEPGQTVSISGAGFSSIPSNNIVYFGATRANVLSATSTSLQVNVPAGGIVAPLTVTVNGLTAYSAANFVPTYLGAGMNLSAGSFGPRFELGAGSGPYLTRIADMDCDGRPDLLVVQLYSGEVWIYRNIATNGLLAAASFAPPVVLATGAGVDGLHGMALADLDGDGRLDIVLGNTGGNKVFIFQNFCSPGAITTNSFGTRVDLVAGTQPFDVAVNDLDFDGKPDIAVCNYGSGTISVIHNHANVGVLTTASFANKIDFAAPAGVHGVALADIDGDGKPDIVAVGSSGVSDVTSVLQNLSSPGIISTNSFAPRVDFAGGGEMVVVADLDRDGKLDLVTGSYQKSVLSLFHNNSMAGSISASSFSTRVDFSAGGQVHQVAVGDLDGDGRLDISLVTQSPDAAAVFINRSTSGAFGTNSLAPAFSMVSGANPAAVAIADLDADGRPELLIANTFGTTLSIYQNLAPYASAPVITTQPASQSVVVGGSVSFTVQVNGTSPFEFQWRFAGTNIAGATTSGLSLTNVQIGDAGFYSVVVSNTIGSTLSSNALLTVNPAVATISVVNQTVLAGNTVAVPVVLAANGNENGAGFTLTFDPALLSFQGVTATSNLTLFVNTSQVAGGKVGVLVARQPGTTFEPGPQELIQASFTASLVGTATSTAVGFGNTPLPEQLSDIYGNSLPYQFIGGQVSIGAVQFEADVSPRPNGDGAVKLFDWVLLGRYAARLDYPTNSAEFERADCAPRVTLGDGAIDITDWVQAGRYAAGLDPLAAAGGPTNEIVAQAVLSKAVPRGAGSPSTVRASAPLWLQGQIATLSIYMDAQGTENALGFGLSYDPAALTFVGATLGNSAAGATLNVNTNQAASGKLGFALALGAGSKFSVGAHELIRVNFKAASTAPASVAASFIDQPVSRQVADVSAAVLSSSFANASIVIHSPPGLSVLNSHGSVTLTWPAWATNFVLQETSSEINSNSWNSLSATPSTNANGEATVDLPIDNTRKFYRLFKP